MEDNKKELKLNKQEILLRVVVVLAIALFLTIGFAFGKITSKDYKCSQNPLIYGIELFNKANEDYYECDCYGEKTSFSFNEDSMSLNEKNHLFNNMDIYD